MPEHAHELPGGPPIPGCLGGPSGPVHADRDLNGLLDRHAKLAKLPRRRPIALLDPRTERVIRDASLRRSAAERRSAFERVADLLGALLAELAGPPAFAAARMRAYD